ncbi:MAG: restriction endonuclease [Actinobacteria bacterium]|nr:restriction endonuclease [Actinomycetota bacterium]
MEKTEKYITKEDGKQELFDEEKIKKSFLKAGADINTAASATYSIKNNLRNYMQAKDVYNQAIKHLRKKQPLVALKYTLKKAIMDLGPTGYVFEKYIAKILKEYGFKTEVSRFVTGFCVDHEVDVIAEKAGGHYMIECKYHNNSDTGCDIKTALYVHSRFQDIKKGCEANLNSYNLKEGWLATNTKVTSEVIKYANCVKLKIIAWHYPEQENLEYFIENKKLYPVSILQGLNNQQKIILFNQDTITIKDFLEYTPDSIARTIHTNSIFAHRLFEQAEMLIS